MPGQRDAAACFALMADELADGSTSYVRVRRRQAASGTAVLTALLAGGPASRDDASSASASARHAHCGEPT